MNARLLPLTLATLIGCTLLTPTAQASSWWHWGSQKQVEPTQEETTWILWCKDIKTKEEAKEALTYLKKNIEMPLVIMKKALHPGTLAEQKRLETIIEGQASSTATQTQESQEEPCYP
jgi:hypothetical protein